MYKMVFLAAILIAHMKSSPFGSHLESGLFGGHLEFTIWKLDFSDRILNGKYKMAAKNNGSYVRLLI